MNGRGVNIVLRVLLVHTRRFEDGAPMEGQRMLHTRQ